MGSKKPDADLVVYLEGSAKNQGDIQLIIECKRESTEATDKKEGVGQLQRLHGILHKRRMGDVD